MSGDYKKLGKNTLIFTIGNFSSKLLNYLLVPLYTYALTTSEYGVVDLITTTVNLLIPVLTLSISEAIMRFSLDKETDRSAVLSFGLTLSALSSLLIIVLSPLLRLSSIIDENFGLFMGVYISHVLSSVLGQFSKGCEKVKIYTIAAVLQTVSFLSFNILFLLVWKWGISGYLLANILSNGLNILFISVFARVDRYLRVLRRCDFRSIRKMLLYSIPLIPNNISWWISNSSDKYVLTLFHGTAVVGLYSTAYKIPSILQIFTTIFWSAWQISAVEDFGSKASVKFFSDVYKSLSSMMAIVCAFVITLSEVIALFAFQKSFFAAWRFSPILIFSFLFSGMSSFLGTIYTSAKKTRSIFISTTLGALLNIVMNFVLIPRYSGYGAAIATLFSYFAIWVFRVFDSQKIIKLDINLGKDALNYVIIATMTIVMIISPSPIKYIILLLGVFFICLNERNFIRKMVTITRGMMRRK